MAELILPSDEPTPSCEEAARAATAAPRETKVETRRETPRYSVVKPVVAIPVMPGSRLDWDHHVEGFSWDVSYGGLGLSLDVRNPLRTKELLIAVDDGQGWSYAGIQVRHTRPADSSGLRIGGRFAGEAHRILTPTNLVPALDRQTMQYDLPVDQKVLEHWAELGILQPALIDRVEVCPKCEGLPTFRQGCSACGSAWLEQERLIHHFACAHVGRVSDFEQQGTLVCPKCRTRSLVVGADFEYLQGAFRCANCHHRDTERRRIGECLRCGHRFPAEQVVCLELIGYHANLLDPISLLEEH